MNATYETKGYLKNGMAYNRLGKGPTPLIVFQGLMMENKPVPASMLGFYKFLGGEYTVFAVLRRRGLPRGMTLKDMADEYAVMIQEEFGAGPFDVIGVSTGGSIVQHFAADHPGLVRRLVIHSSAYTLSPSARELQMQTARLAESGRWKDAYALITAALLPDGGVWQALSKPVLWAVPPLMALGAPKDANDLVVTVEAEDVFNFKDRLGEIQAPTLVAGGEKDPFYSPVLFQETAAGIPGAQLKIYPGMGHPASGKQFEQDVMNFLHED